MTRIGPYTLPSKVLLAPMSGCTDLSFRMIAREHGARFCFFEMVDAHSVTYHRRKTFAMLKSCEGDDPIAVQILGNDPQIMLNAAREIISRVNAAFIDINAACPAKKVIKKRAGAYLLKNGNTLCETIRLLATSLSLPVTVKMRTGYGGESVSDITALARRCESSGAAAIFIHGRTRSQGYSGAVNYEAIRAVKDAVGIPVVGSGDVLSPELAEMMLSRTGCDAILVARGSLGNPWIFSDIDNYLKSGGMMPRRGIKETKDVLKRHLSYMYKHMECGDPAKVGVMRKVALWYLRSLPNSKKMRGEISLVKTYEKMIKLIDSFN
ncbi:MAG: tRNA dihydrouridine synthase DusB [Candidatus Omnitrophica bacterium]|nr:tRNA dihydrouridine synthase DusB [Candidatus Omnitrophota bacterium]